MSQPTSVVGTRSMDRAPASLASQTTDPPSAPTTSAAAIASTKRRFVRALSPPTCRA